MGRGRKSEGVCKACVHSAAAARRQRIAALKAQGASSSVIAEEFNVAPSTIRVELHRMRRQRPVYTTTAPVTIGDE